jgi:hypothetical protein
MTAIGNALLIGFLVAAVGATGANAASNDDFFSRETNNAVSVLNRPRPDYDAVGVPIYDFLLFPTLDLSTIYNDNIYATQTNPIGDAIFEIEPQLDLKSQWTDDQLELYSRATIDQYVTHRTENTNDWVDGMNAAADFFSGATVFGKFEFDHLHLPRGSELAEFNTVSPVEYNSSDASIGASDEIDRLKLSATLERADFAYFNGVSPTGVVVSTHYLNYANWSETVRADYAIDPDTAIFVSAEHNNAVYDAKPPFYSLNRDSRGYEFLAGTNFQLTDLMSGEIGAGYLEEEYPYVAGQNVSGFDIHAAVDWYPTPLTTVNVQTYRSVQESAVTTSTSYVDTVEHFEVDHELRHNIILGTTAQYTTNDYQGIDREDRILTAGAKGTLLVNSSLGLTLSYLYDSQVSTGTQHYINFVQNRVSLTLVLQR